jgi:D-serine deaminase-like pyridoxal phosphate-dependent protein
VAGLVATAGVKLRLHAKTHKSPVIAHLQLARGAVGQCTQKVAEAEILAWGGMPDILVSNEVMSPRKLARLAALTRITRVAKACFPCDISTSAEAVPMRTGAPDRSRSGSSCARSGAAFGAILVGRPSLKGRKRKSEVGAIGGTQ